MTCLPDVFLPYQQRLWAAVDAHRVVVVEKSRRTGYSWVLAAIAASTAAASRASGGMDALYMGYEKDMTREFIDYVAEWARAFQLAATAVSEFVWTDPERPERQIGAYRIGFDSGFEVIALPSVARALRGKQGLVILDEAAFMDDLDAVLKSAFALLIWGGRVVVCSTHDGDTNPFNVLVTEARAGRRPYHVLRTTFDEAVAEGLYRRICLTQGAAWSPAAEAAWVAGVRAEYGDSAEEELDVSPNPSSGTWLPGPLIEARAEPGIAVLRWHCVAGFAEWAEHLRAAEARDWCEALLQPVLAALPPGVPHVMGLDFARRGDLTVLWVLGIGSDLVRRTALVVELRDCPFRQQEQVLYFVCDRLPRFRAAALDATGNGMYLAEVAMQRYGALVAQVMLNEPWYREHMPPMKAAFEDAMVTVPRDRELVDDLRGLKMVRGVARIPERTRNDEGLRRHGDGAIALALALFASRAEPEMFGYEAAAPANRLQGGQPRHWMQPRDEDEDRAARHGQRALRGAL